jgi:hypothetical protein
MKDFSFYEQTGILIPGAVLALGVPVFLPDLRSFFEQGDISIGGLGIFVLVAYVAGHGYRSIRQCDRICVVAGAGRYAVELGHWWSPHLLQRKQRQRLQPQIGVRLGIGGIDLAKITQKEWTPIFQQVYRDVLANNPGRVEVFNGNYGLNRGLGAALAGLAILFSAAPPHQ